MVDIGLEILGIPCSQPQWRESRLMEGKARYKLRKKEKLRKQLEELIKANARKEGVYKSGIMAPDGEIGQPTLSTNSEGTSKKRDVTCTHCGLKGHVRRSSLACLKSSNRKSNFYKTPVADKAQGRITRKIII